MKKRIMQSALSLILLLAGCGAPAAVQESAAPEKTASAEPSAPEVQEETYSASLFVAGDCLIHMTVANDAKQEDGSYDFMPILEKIGEYADGYDLKYYNQESIIGGEEFGYSGYPRFNAPHEVADAMVSMGFNLVSTANNHSLDMGEKGIENSHAYWSKQEGVVTAGTNLSQEERDTIPMMEINGIRIAFLSWTYGTNGLVPPEGKEYLVNVYAGHEEELLDQVRRAKKEADAVIVAMHWGTEYSMQVNEEQKDLAQKLSDAGADIIIGAHPHVIQPVAWINGHQTICFYSLGNMISAQIDEPDRVGMIGGVTITKNISGGQSTVTVSDPCADLIWDQYEGGYVHFKAMPFAEIQDESLQSIYQKYLPVITEMSSEIQVGVKRS